MLYYIYRLCLPKRKEQAINPQKMRFPMYHNFIFDLYGTLVDIAGTAAQISSVRDGRPHRTFSLRLPGDLRCGHFPDSVYRKRDPPHRSPSDRYQSVLPD